MYAKSKNEHKIKDMPIKERDLIFPRLLEITFPVIPEESIKYVPLIKDPMDNIPVNLFSFNILFIILNEEYCIGKGN